MINYHLNEGQRGALGGEGQAEGGFKLRIVGLWPSGLTTAVLSVESCLGWDYRLLAAVRLRTTRVRAGLEQREIIKYETEVVDLNSKFITYSSQLYKSQSQVVFR